MFLHFLIYPSSFHDNDWPEFLINFEKFQPLEEVLGSGPLSFCFRFKSDGGIDTMIKMPPTTQKVVVVPHKINGIEENLVLGQIIQHLMEFVHCNWFNQWKLDLWDRVQLFIWVGH